MGWDCMTGTGDPATLHNGRDMGGVLWVGLVLPCRCACGIKVACLLMLNAIKGFGFLVVGVDDILCYIAWNGMEEVPQGE